MVMGACPGQIPMPCVPPSLTTAATMVRACRYKRLRKKLTNLVASVKVQLLIRGMWII